MNRTTETIGNATGTTGWRKTWQRNWTPPAQPCGAWGKKMQPDVQAQALQAFGADRQVDKCIEELGELATALVKYRHGEATADQVIDELADVQVSTGTLWLLFDRKSIEARIAVKLARLQRLVADQVQAKVQENPFRELVREPRPGETKCGQCMWWGAQGQRNTVGVCMHKDRASRDRGYMAAADCSLSAPKPEPAPVKPVLRWEDEGNALVLYSGRKQIGMVEQHRSGRWIGDPFGKPAASSVDKAQVMRHVERTLKFPEVPLWTP